MTTIVDEFTNGMSADTARANMRAVVEAYGYDGSGSASDVRAFANTLLVPAGRNIGAAELGGGLRDDWNLLRDPAAITQAMLDLIAGSQHFPILPSTVFSDDAGTTPAVIGGPVGAVRDMNGDVVATATGTARPTFGVHPASGLRNLMLNSRFAGIVTGPVVSLLSVEGLLISRTNDADTPQLDVVSVGADSVGEFIDLRIFGPNTSGAARFFQVGPASSVRCAAGQSCRVSMDLQVISNTGAATPQALLFVQYRDSTNTLLAGGGVVQTPTTTMTRYSVLTSAAPANTTQITNRGLSFRVNDGEAVDFTIRIRRMQVEFGTVETAYQATRLNGFDVTEVPFRDLHYLAPDVVDDFMTLAAAFAPAGAYTLAAAVDVPAGVFSPVFGRAAGNAHFAITASNRFDAAFGAPNRRVWNPPLTGRQIGIFRGRAAADYDFCRNGVDLAEDVGDAAGNIVPAVNPFDTIGRNGASYANMRFYGGALAPAALSDAQRNLLKRSLAWASGVTLP
jgi:hypothetical protein